MSTTTSTCASACASACATSCAATCPTASHCLCTLPPNPHPYTCLSLYAVSVVPKCPRCSGPCTHRVHNGTYTFRCSDTDPYYRTLLLLSVILGSCSPEICAAPLHTELVRLQTALAFDGTAAECAIEQHTTYVYSAVDRWSSRVGVDWDTAFLRIGLGPFALGGLADRLLQRLSQGGACSDTCLTDPTSPTPMEPLETRITLDRFLFYVYQQLHVVRQQLDIAIEVTQMVVNAIEYRTSRERGIGGRNGGVPSGWISLEEDDPVHHRYGHTTTTTSMISTTTTTTTTTPPNLSAAQSHLRTLTTLRAHYHALCTAANEWLECTLASTTYNVPTLPTLSAQWTPVAHQLRQLATTIAQDEMQSTSSSLSCSGIHFIADPTLDQQLNTLAIQHVSLSTQQPLESSLTSIRCTFFEGCSTTTCGGDCAYACNALVGCTLKERLRGLRRWVGLGGGVRWVG